jgi:hypothetical protein
MLEFKRFLDITQNAVELSVDKQSLMSFWQYLRVFKEVRWKDNSLMSGDLIYIICVIIAIIIILCVDMEAFYYVGCSVTSAFIAIGKFLISCWKAYYRSIETALNWFVNIHRVRITIRNEQHNHPRMLDDTERKIFIEKNQLPERFWSGNADKFMQEFLDDKIDIQEFEDKLNEMMGINNEQ